MSRVVHFEISADQPDRAIRFYENTFGWQFTKWDVPMPYWLVTASRLKIVFPLGSMTVNVTASLCAGFKSGLRSASARR